MLEVEDEIYEKGCLLIQLEENIYKQNTEELICIFREKISVLREELHQLYQRQKEVEKEIKYQSLLKQLGLCA